MCRITRNLRGARSSRARRPTGSAAKRRDSGISPPVGEIQRDPHLVRTTGRGVADQRSTAYPHRWAMGNRRGPRIHRPACSAANGGDSWGPPLGPRWRAKSPPKWRGLSIFHTSRISSRWVESPDGPGGSPTFDNPPPGRLYIDGAR